VPITKDHAEYAETVVQQLKSLQIRAENWDQAESMQKRIRNAEKAKVPYMLIVGDQEKASESVSVRQRGNHNLGTLSLLDIAERLQKEIKEKTR
jgi:threonyl-tRNA synthetase